MSDYAKIADALRFTASAISDHKLEVLSLRTLNDGATAIEELMAFDIRNLPEGLYTVKNGVVYTAKVKVSGGNVLNMKTGESHWEDDRIVGGEQVFPKPEPPKEGTHENRDHP